MLIPLDSLFLDTERAVADNQDFSNEVLTPRLKPTLDCIAKWNLKFSGDDKTLSLNAFLDRVEELRFARVLSPDDLLRSAVDLFDKQALVWYRSRRHTFDSWKNLVSCLREEFLPPDYDDRLTEEIKLKTQGPDEKVGIFVAGTYSIG